jgi:hypothetical protein
MRRNFCFYYDVGFSLLMPTIVNIHNPMYTAIINQLNPVNFSSEEITPAATDAKIIWNIKHIPDTPHNILNDLFINANTAKTTGKINDKKAIGKALAPLVPAAVLKAV